MVVDALGVMRNIFTNVQFSKTSHQSNQKKLKKLYSMVQFDTFAESFIDCLKISLTRGERHVHVENTLEFAAKFAVSLYSPENADTTDHMCPFLTRLFDFILTRHNAKDLSVRFRLCHFLNMLLNSMGDDAFIEDNLCDKITSTMMERVMDKSPKVRAQAILALQRLQDPTDDHCQVIKVYIFHLSKDPSSEVRKAVLASMAKNQKALLAVLKRTRDVDDSVRKMAYEFISKVTVRSLTINQREALLNDGLKDRSEVVSKVVRNVLLPTWLLHFNENYVKLLRALDAESATETAILAMNVLFKRASIMKLLEQIPVDGETKLIPYDKLTSESVLYWRCLVEFLHRESCVEEIEQCLPELTKFCDYIRRYLETMESKNNDFTDPLTLKFILQQLFKITETYDLSDELGRTNLSQLILDTLLSDMCSEKLTESIVMFLENVVPNVENRLSSVAHVISEIRLETRQNVPTQLSEDDQHRKKLERAKLKVNLNEIQEEEYEAIRNRDFLRAQALKEQIEAMTKELDELTDSSVPAIIDYVCEEKNDAETMIKCLTIMCATVAGKSITTLTATLRSLLENLALPSIDHENVNVHILALKAVAMCCLLDPELAKKHIMMYLFQFSLEQDIRGIWLISLQAIFDLLLQYGLEFFGIIQDDNDNTVTRDKSRKSGPIRLYSHTEDDMTGTSIRSETSDHGTAKFVKILIGLLDNADQELRTIATEGLCKLLLHGRISGVPLLSRLIILFYNPVSEDDVYLRQCLCNFFKTFIVRVPDSQEMLEQAFMPTLKTLANAPDMSPLQAIEPHHVAKIILGLTSSRMHKPGMESYTVHNNLAQSILTEALDPTSEIDQESLLKSLKYLDIYIEDNQLRSNLREAADKIEESLKESDKRLIRYIQAFKIKLADIPEPEEPGVNKENSGTIMETREENSEATIRESQENRGTMMEVTSRDNDSH